MSSSVFFRFKSQKEPSRVTFDGTGISVFELKREIIVMNKLGDGTDFELIIGAEGTNEIYDDDTSIIPRSTTVIAKRLPPVKPGRGSAARYVSGKMPQNAKTSHRLGAPTVKAAENKTNGGLTAVNGAQTEEEKLAAVFKMGADQWAQQQQEMANVTPVHRSGPHKGKPANVPDHPPPSGYICYRCGEKGHWIQVCPTNDDPAYENRPRVKRTTGIPRSFLKTVEKPTALANDGTIDDTKQPAGVMVNAEGEWVVAEPDKAAWDQYQAKAKVSAAAHQAAKEGSRELQDRGLECSIDKHLFVDPTKTPCCQTTFCHDCIVNALLENDLRCPICSTESILIDNLTFDEEMNNKLRSYEREKTAIKAKEEVSTPSITEQSTNGKSPSGDVSARLSPSLEGQTMNSNSKKRSADGELANERRPSAPKERTTGHSSTDVTRAEPQTLTNKSNTSANQSYQQPTELSAVPQGTNAMMFPGMNGFMPLGMTMAPMIGMNPMFQNTSMMPNGSYMRNDWVWGGGFQQQPMDMQHGSFHSGMTGNGSYTQINHFHGPNGMNMVSMGSAAQGQGRGSFANQQRTTFGAHSINNEDSAYFRKPVNPHRHQAKRNVQRPTDYREV